MKSTWIKSSGKHGHRCHVSASGVAPGVGGYLHIRTERIKALPGTRKIRLHDDERAALVRALLPDDVRDALADVLHKLEHSDRPARGYLLDKLRALVQPTATTEVKP